MVDKVYCFSICPIVLVIWWVALFLAGLWNYGAHYKSKKFEEHHGYRYSTDNGNSLKKEAEAFGKLGLQISSDQQKKHADSL